MRRRIDDMSLCACSSVTPGLSRATACQLCAVRLGFFSSCSRGMNRSAPAGYSKVGRQHTDHANRLRVADERRADCRRRTPKLSLPKSITDDRHRRRVELLLFRRETRDRASASRRTRRSSRAKPFPSARASPRRQPSTLPRRRSIRPWRRSSSSAAANRRRWDR